MIESIRQSDKGYHIRTDKEDVYLDYIEIHDIIAYDNERIVGYNDDGKLAIINTTTHECEIFTKFEVNYKRYSIMLCGSQKCWYQCSNPDEEYYYAKVFDYLGKCPEFNYIPDLIAYLLSEYIKLVDLETVLNGTWDDYIPLYSDGVDGGFRLCGNQVPPSEIQHLYYEEHLNNWNEGLDREMTKDMHLTRVFHNLYDHMEFSIFDLLWVRDFNIEVSVEVDSSSYPTGYEYEDIDPHRDFSKILNNE